MKKLILIALIVPFFTKKSEAQFTLSNSSTVSLVELRSASDAWPLDLQRVIKQTDTSYALNFRDQQYANTVVMSTLKFKDKAQVKYFQQALSSLTSLGTGTTANFKGFSIKRADKMNFAEADQPVVAPDPAPAPVTKTTTAKSGGKTAKKAAPVVAQPAPPVATKKVSKKVDEVWYLLTCEDGTVTNFQQSEADRMIAAILPL
jgi:hypothetical protein